MSRTADSIAEVVTSGLCIGCGLCEAMTGGRIKVQMTPDGTLRPSLLDSFRSDEEARILKICPGVIAEPRSAPGLETDPIWGAFSSSRFAWAGDPDIRFRAATGGVLTALGVHLLRTGKARFIYHACANPDAPMRNIWAISETPDEVIARAGSRYGPTAALAGLNEALDREQPFAIIVKPCELGAVHQLAKTDPRIDRYCIARLTMVCGGQSKLTKSQLVLDHFGIDEDQLTVFRYRGYGNPGRTRIETRDGRAFERTYVEHWADESTWLLETRCKMCPDPLGEAADLAALDVWPGGTPVGEDAGINGIVVRTATGAKLVEEAVADGSLVLGETLTIDYLNDCQPHQVSKKYALAARFEAFAEAGLPAIDVSALRFSELSQHLSPDEHEREKQGTLDRINQGRIIEPAPPRQGVMDD
jgi:coenzyme F420 hydrogenase subunit beta